MKKLMLAVALLCAGATFAQAADPIEARWRRPNGTVLKFVRCGGGFCAIVQTGEFKGKTAGKLTRSGDGYKGSITELSSGKTYSGTAEIVGNSLSVTGCAFKVFCKSESWAHM